MRQYIVEVKTDGFEKNVSFEKRLNAIKYANSYVGLTKALQSVRMITYNNTVKESEKLFYMRGLMYD